MPTTRLAVARAWRCHHWRDSNCHRRHSHLSRKAIPRGAPHPPPSLHSNSSTSSSLRNVLHCSRAHCSYPAMFVSDSRDPGASRTRSPAVRTLISYVQRHCRPGISASEPSPHRSRQHSPPLAASHLSARTPVSSTALRAARFCCRRRRSPRTSSTMHCSPSLSTSARPGPRPHAMAS